MGLENQMTDQAPIQEISIASTDGGRGLNVFSSSDAFATG